MLSQSQTTDKKWKEDNQYGIRPILLTALFTLIAYFFLLHVGFGIGKNVIHHPAFAGLVGAVLRALYWLQYQTNKGLLRPRWFTSFIVAPFIGVILGWLVSLLIAAIAIVVSGSQPTTDWRVISLLALFAGFKWERALEWMTEAAKSIQARIKEKAPATAPKKP